MNMPFVKNQMLQHNTWGECIALRAWNEKETVCLVPRAGKRMILSNMFLREFHPEGNPQLIGFLEDKDLAELELNIEKAKR